MNPVIHELFQKTRYLTNDLNHQLNKHKLFASQWAVLYCIKIHEQMSLTQIWKYLNVEAPTVTRTVYRLVELGWVEIRPGKDRREKIVRLTEKALECYPDISITIIAFEERATSNLTSEEQEILLKLLQKIK